MRATAIHGISIIAGGMSIHLAGKYLPNAEFHVRAYTSVHEIEKLVAQGHEAVMSTPSASLATHLYVYGRVATRFGTAISRVADKAVESALSRFNPALDGTEEALRRAIYGQLLIEFMHPKAAMVPGARNSVAHLKAAIERMQLEPGHAEADGERRKLMAQTPPNVARSGRTRTPWLGSSGPTRTSPPCCFLMRP
jgi:hypothetical protein